MDIKQSIPLNIDSFNEHKAAWARVAQQNGWYTEPFYIMVWLDTDGQVVDSVATRELTSHYAFDAQSDLPIGAFTAYNDHNLKIKL